MNVYVAMANDSSEAVFSSEAAAEEFVAEKNAEDKRQYPHRRVFWRAYAHELRGESAWRERRALDMARLTLRQIAGQSVDKELFRHLAVVTLVRITEVLGEDA